ncbi:MAG: sn-glycerol-3-phosphate ABC transporter ATP-binding protein UgpC [Deltaproteobacteria bacterium]|nr:sn-glycerol-3-phosphate ABC transporter ATP-binding protein UgpC [Deltaproteobacteria bacterium]
MATVELRDVGKLYGDTRAVQGVNLSVADGEFLVLVGPSGCGKSTLLRMVAGLEEISEGELRIGGSRANEKAPRDRDVAMVFQSYALYPHMTVRQNMAFGLKVRKEDPAEIARRVNDAARMLELEPLLDRLPKAMSGGQRQRVALGRAIVRQPEVFLFDEPLSNLDAALRTQMRGELKALHAQLGSTMLYVTHDQVEAMTLADRIAVLRLGVLQQAGTPRELFERPANRFVAGFIGSPAMNFIEGQIEDGAFAAGSATFPLSDLGEATEGGACTLGVRPHELLVQGTDAAGLSGRVGLVEPTGWESMVHVDTDLGRLVARVETRALGTIAEGSAVTVRPSEAVHLFASGETGAALRHPA